MLQFLALMTITASLASGALLASPLVAVLATFVLPAITYFENRVLVSNVMDHGHAGHRIIAWAFLRSLGNAAAISFAAYLVGIVARTFWIG